MDKIRFRTIMKRGVINNEMYGIGIMHGLEIALCDIESETLGFDCDVFKDCVVFVTNTTLDNYKKFRDTVNKIYPGLCEFDEKAQ